MTETEHEITDEQAASSKWPFVAAIVALIGIADSVYLAVHHYTAEPIPCSLTGGCETVLTSAYAEIAGIPIAAFGALAYFVAFSLSILAAFGNRAMWLVFGLQATAMAAVSLYLIYVQAFVLNAFCQFCLVSAATSISLFLIFAASRVFKRF
jgi:uncharacterized membrane protein